MTRNRTLAVAAVAVLLGPGPAGAPAAARPAGMVAALAADLGITAGQAQDRLDRAEAAQAVAELLEAELGGRFGGAWLDDAQQLVVASTDKADTPRITAAGALPRIVEYSVADLDRAQDTLDRTAVTSSYVDIETNTVVVRGSAPKAATAGPLRFEAPGSPALAAAPAAAQAPLSAAAGETVRGADSSVAGVMCSVGFSVAGGYVTAGHCGDVGTPASRQNPDGSYTRIGTYAGSVFPGADMAWVRTDPGVTPEPLVRGPGGTTIRVAGARAALVGSAVCRGGHDTGWHCGEIESLNATVDFSFGTVRGLTRTDVCAESADFGGPYLTGNQAQGTLVGWRTFPSSNCPTGGVFEDESYFQPIHPTLSRFGLSLLVSPGTISGLSCSVLVTTFRCTVTVNPGAAPQISWVDDGTPRPGWAGRSTVTGTCTRGEFRTVRVTVTTADGPDTASRSLRCEGDR